RGAYRRAGRRTALRLSCRRGSIADRGLPRHRAMLERWQAPRLGSVRQRRRYCSRLAPGGQPVPDCRQAKTAADKAICGNVQLAAADKAMADSYTALRAKLPPEQQKT